MWRRRREALMFVCGMLCITIGAIAVVTIVSNLDLIGTDLETPYDPDDPTTDGFVGILVSTLLIAVPLLLTFGTAFEFARSGPDIDKTDKKSIKQIIKFLDDLSGLFKYEAILVPGVVVINPVIFEESKALTNLVAGATFLEFLILSRLVLHIGGYKKAYPKEFAKVRGKGRKRKKKRWKRDRKQEQKRDQKRDQKAKASTNSRV